MTPVIHDLRWSITERLSHRWECEYLLLDADAGAVACTALTDGQRIYAAQYDPQRKALVTCVDLEPGTELSLTPCEAAAPETGLTVLETPGAIIFSNSHCAAYLANAVTVHDLGEAWEITGPLQAVVGPDGQPRTGSRLEVRKSRLFAHDRAAVARLSPEAIAAEETPPAVKIEIDARGPVFARYRYKLTMFDGRCYSWTATLYADHPILYVEESANLDREGAMEIDITRNFPCDLYAYHGDEDIRNLSINPIPPAPYYLGSLAPHHTNHQLPYPWLTFLQSRRPQGSFRGIGETEVTPYTDALCIMGHLPWTWEYPGESTLRFTALEGRRMVARGGLARGTRKWCLFSLSRQEVMTPHRFTCGTAEREVSQFAVWHRKLNDLPLDMVRRFDLTSGTPTPQAFPQALLTPEEYQAKQPLFAELAEELGSVLERKDAGALFARVILKRDRTAAEQLAELISRVMEEKLALVLHTGFLSDAMSAVANRNLGPYAVFFEACIAFGVLNEAQIARLRTSMLLFAYASADCALFPIVQNYLPPDLPRSCRNWTIAQNYSDVFGTPNFQTDVYYNIGLYAAVFHQHPMAEAWRDEAVRQFRDQLAAHFFLGGVYKESIGYFAHLFHNMLSLASVIKRHGGPDMYADPTIQGAITTLIDYLGAPRNATVERLVTPERAAEGQQRYWPAIGDTGYNCTEAPLQSLLAHAAWEVRAHDPALSDRALAAWGENGRPLWGSYFPQFDFLYLDNLNPQVPPLTPTMQSRRFMHIGVMLRADVGLPSETSLFFRSGRGTHHWGFDHGHVTLTSRGSLLIPDFGYYGKETARDGATVPGYDTNVHNVAMFGEFRQSGLSAERQRAETVVRLGGDYDYVVADLSFNTVRPAHWRNAQPVEYVEYFRHLLFAHNRYILIWDRIDFSIYPSLLRLNALASSVEIDGAQAHFHGFDGVDLRVTMVTPESPEFTEGLVGPMRYLLCRQPCERDYLWVAQPIGPGETPFTITRDEHAVHIAGTDLHGQSFTDHILYTKGDHPVIINVSGRPRTLSGRCAVIREQGEGEQRVLLEGESLA